MAPLVLCACAETNPSVNVTPVAVEPVEPPTMTFAASFQGLPEEGMWKCDPTMGDVNGDGHLDLAAIPRLSDGPRVWLGDGMGNWTDSSEGLKPAVLSCGGGVEFGHVNHDGLLDLVVADHCHGVAVYLGDGKGTWRPVVEGLNPRGMDIDPTDPELQMYVGTEDIALGDMNQDGHLDIVAGASDEGGVHVYLGDGSGVAWDRVVECGLPPLGWANRVVVEDMDGDERPDVVLSFGDGPRVWRQVAGEQLAFEPWSEGLPSPMMQGIYTGLAVGDVDEDGDVDIAIANWVDGPEVYLQETGGTWRKAPPVFNEMEGGAVGLALGEVDGDGHLDLMVSGRMKVESGFCRGVFPLRGDGRGGFKLVKGSGLPETGLAATTGVVLGDVNNDGILDVAAASGLIVETVPGGPTDPDIPHRMLVWLTTRPGAVDKPVRPEPTPLAAGNGNH